VRKLRTAQFELRAKNLGIVGEKLIAEKVAIWEGLWTTRQIGDDIGVSILPFFFFAGCRGIIANQDGDFFIARRLGSVRLRHRRRPVTSSP